ncbi:murein biosynthesis integral membrane protein MurJ [Actinomyces wuliandei]|uniref:murein biosynthesis integral membrane protein MurJ n=1 Tax=Actinomyces wuliandei TaxID=2057743 RepID=UPI000FD77C61|nr:lipid II flippase MurJ [Actinomyces wuliandei]
MAGGPARGGLAAAGGVAGLTLVSRVLGLGRWVVQAVTVGSGTVAGAYSTANQVPNVLYEVVVGGALAATVVPLLAGAVSDGRQEEARATASGLLGVVLVVLTPLAVLLAVLAEPVAAAFPVSQGVDASVQVSLVAGFLRMFALQVPLYGLGVVLTGILQAHGSFTWPALTPVLSSVTVMGTYGLYAAMGGWRPEGGEVSLYVLGWGTTAGVAALSLPLLWPVHRLGLGLRPSLDLGGAVARRAWRLGAAGVWTLLAQQLSVVVVLALARSAGTTGTVAVYQYTQAVYALPYAVLVVPVATVLYPRLSAAFGSGQREDRPEAGRGWRVSVDGSGGRAGERDGEGTGSGGQSSPGVSPWAVRGLVADATALVTAVALAGAGMLLVVSQVAERFFSLLAPVEGMGAALAVLSPALVGYALIYQVTRVLYVADRAADAARSTVAGWLAVAVASAVCVRLLAPQGADASGTLVALALGQGFGMTVAAVALGAAAARCFGAGVLAGSLAVLGAGTPVVVLLGLGLRAAVAAVEPVAVATATAAVGAVVCAAAVAAAAATVHRGILHVLRGQGRHGSADTGSQGSG